MSFYNTSPPTIVYKNNINDITVNYGIRDYLLSKNIINPIKYPWLSTTINGGPRGGEPVLETMQGSGAIIQHAMLEVDGLSFAQSAISGNRYLNTQSVTDALVNIVTLPLDDSFFPNSTAPNGTEPYPTSSPQDWEFGIKAKSDEKQYRKLLTLKNLYLDASKQVDIADYVSLQPLNVSAQITGYLDAYGSLNGSSAGNQAADVIGSILTGQGVGFTPNGVVSNFDFKSSLIGRVLGAAGVVNDTRLGLIGGQQLGLALANNAAFNLQQSTIGRLNLNPISLLRGNDFIVPNYKITVPLTTGGKILNTIANIAGFTVPKSFLQNEGSIFTSENGGGGNIERSNHMLDATGKGQRNILLTLMSKNVADNGSSMFRSGYAPGFKGHDYNPNIYAFSVSNFNNFVQNFISTKEGEYIPEISYNREKLVEASDFVGFENGNYIKNTGPFGTPFTWTSNVGDTINAIENATPYRLGASKSILTKTQKLFNSKGMMSLVSVKGNITIQTPSQLQTAVQGGLSKGSAVKTSGYLSGIQTSDPSDTFCRAWTSLDRYDSVNNLIRNRGLNQNPDGSQMGGLWRRNTINSVLDDNGFVKISPYKGENLSSENVKAGNINVKKYMFSIENLAWKGTAANQLLPVERGPGDLLTGEFGRIMWFPPYDIAFTENNTAAIESTNFIGRGEPVYTYSNTERTGTLTFKIIIDHPSTINGMQGSNGPADDYINSYFAGCVNLEKKWADKLTTDESETVTSRNTQRTQQKVLDIGAKPADFEIFFPNDVYEIDKITETYESGDNLTSAANKVDNDVIIDSSTSESIQASGVVSGSKRYYVNARDYGMNKIFRALNLVELREKIKQCTTCKILITGYASKSGEAINSKGNTDIAQLRADAVKAWIISNNLIENSSKRITAYGMGLLGCNELPNQRTDEECLKEARKASVKFVNGVDGFIPDTLKPDIVEGTEDVTVKTTVMNRFYNEANFFERMKHDDPFIFDTIREKIRYFHPSFHSTTPEGFNARLTFLNQCVRQGPTYSTKNVNNLVFGAPPVCILRIGDFYNTKIMIDNIGYDFEPLVWDLNPEGVGVQPMIANVTMSFKMIGGASLFGPINKLQNAVSFNFFANTELVDKRADSIAYKDAKYELQAGRAMDKDANIMDIKTTIDTSTSNFNPVLNQVINSNLATGPNSVVPNSSTESKITKINVDTPYQPDTTVEYWIIKLQLEQENLVNQDDIDKYISKSVKIKIRDANSKYNYEKILTSASIIEYFVGKTIDDDSGILKSQLPEGTYQLSIDVEGKNIGNKVIILKN